MDVFICWSGAASHELAKGLREWLPLVIQKVQPWVSSVDIAKGQVWNDELRAKLKSAGFGILCVTPENLKEPWIHFEAGSLANRFDSPRVTALSLDIKFSQLPSTISQFQNTEVSKSDIEKLVLSLNSALAEPLPEERVRKTFGVFWPEFEKSIVSARTALAVAKVPGPPERTSAEMFEEIVRTLHDVRREIAGASQEMPKLGRLDYLYPNPIGGRTGLAAGRIFPPPGGLLASLLDPAVSPSSAAAVAAAVEAYAKEEKRLKYLDSLEPKPEK